MDVPNGQRPLKFSTLSYHPTTTTDSENASMLASDGITGCTENMLLCRWSENRGWEDPEIRPYGPLSIMPSASVLQYATECFEGIKAYRGVDGKLRFFRIGLNCRRMLQSSVRVGLPAFDLLALEQLFGAFATLEAERWLPKNRPEETLYFRPTHIGTTAALGVQRPRHSLLYVIATLAPGFSTNGGMKLLTSPANTYRAWPGGFGDAKLGANYGPTVVEHGKATSEGFDQVLWLFGPEGYITEAGASNFFVVLKTVDGKTQLITAGLEKNIILAGITRQSVIDIVSHRANEAETWIFGGKVLEPLTVVERDISIGEIQEALAEGRLVEAFASGTAYFIAPVHLIRHREKELVIPHAAGASGHYAQLIKGWLGDIVYGRTKFPEWTTVLAEAGS